MPMTYSRCSSVDAPRADRWGAVVIGLAIAGLTGGAQQKGDWPGITGGDTSTRYSALDQINASNFNTAEGGLGVARRRPLPAVDIGEINARGLPIYVDGMLITVSGPRRTVVSLDPATGKTLWTFQEPTRRGTTTRCARTTARAWPTTASTAGRDPGHTPGFFLHALDAKTGKPLERLGRGRAGAGFPKSGSVDMLKDLIKDWEPWRQSEQKYDPTKGLPLELGYITTSSPPIVVNDVLIVGNSAEQGYNQTRIENVPGDILGLRRQDRQVHVEVPRHPAAGRVRPRDVGERRVEVDGRRLVVGADVGRSGARPRLHPDQRRDHRLLRRLPPGRQPVQHEHHRAGRQDRQARLALPAGQARHLELRHADGAGADGRHRRRPPHPGLFQITKQAFVYSFNRQTGEPIWPIEMRPVPQSKVPGEKLSPTQPFPTKPAPFDLQGRKETDLIDYTPEVKKLALERAKKLDLLPPLFDPPAHRGNAEGRARPHLPGRCRRREHHRPAGGGSDYRGIIFITSTSGCADCCSRQGAGQRQDDRQDAAVAGARRRQRRPARRRPCRMPAIRCSAFPISSRDRSARSSRST